MTGVERLARVYGQITGISLVPKLVENLGRLDDLAELAVCEESVLIKAAHSLGGGPDKGFPVAEWGRAVHRAQALEAAGPGSVQAVFASSLPAGMPRLLRTMLEEVGAYVDSSMKRLAGRYPTGILAEGRDRVLQRALTADFREGALVRRRSRWARYPIATVGLPPVIDADATEEALVHLLALTWPVAQFSYTPRWNGAVFAGWNNGYHKGDDQRVYVTGLSDILDSLCEIVQEHRDGQGGRVYVRDGRVACADCRKVIAWIGSAKSDQPVPPAHVRARIHQ